MPWIIAYNIGLLCGLWIGPLQLAIHLIQNRQAGERKTQNGQDKQKIYIIWNGIFFVYLVPVPLLLSSTTDLYHVNDWLQRAYYCWQWLLKWYVVIELLDVAYSFVSFFFSYFSKSCSLNGISLRIFTDLVMWLLNNFPSLNWSKNWTFNYVFCIL